MIRPPSRVVHLILLSLALVITGCASKKGIKPGTRLERTGDEIVVAGQLFHTGAPVVLWTDPGGYDAYRTERRFAPYEESSYRATTRAAATRPKQIGIDSPNRYGLRESALTEEQRELVRGGGWPLELLQDKVDQFVIHYDVAGTSQRCFYVLHDSRNLSVQFMLDIDGTIYQTMDAKERAWHAGTANSRSVGIEIANMGAYASGEADPFKQWYGKDDKGRTRITVPERLKGGGVRTPNFVGYPIRDELIVGEVQGRMRRQYDLTKQQYDSLIKLTAALCTVLPKIDADYPRDEQGRLINKVLTEDQYDNYSGVLGHYHVTSNKSDPGPAFQWDYVIDNARKLMGKPPKPKRGKVATPSTPTTQPTTRPSGFAQRDRRAR